ncbi:hypothetical protein E2C01_065276 [Portunus trituberculatus]|uniref:Uncharacterized protein n=1 Tax=Portunus trituberculatus TaxID=210409 RepID=A0A5B7HMJ8_PORTR|nr:hypothetical protein [Portunus trituberculatus]
MSTKARQEGEERKVLFPPLTRNVALLPVGLVVCVDEKFTCGFRVIYILEDWHATFAVVKWVAAAVVMVLAGGSKDEAVCHSVLLLVSCFPPVYYADRRVYEVSRPLSCS